MHLLKMNQFQLFIFFFVLALIPSRSFSQKNFFNELLKETVTQSPGDLSSHHQEWDDLNGCINCHQKALGGEVENKKCLDCHPKIEIRLEENRGLHRGKTDCHTCHSEHLGRDGYIFAPQDWLDSFDHEIDAQYALVGKHAAPLACESCHNTKRTHWKTGEQTQTTTYLDAPVQCVGCHDQYHEIGRREELNDCGLCHTSAITNWIKMEEPMPFDHNSTRYPLRGKHEPVTCKTCHSLNQSKLPNITYDSSVKRFAPMKFDRCVNCHMDPHEPSFGDNCESCHSVYREWNEIIVNDKVQSNFDHDTTKFPLVGYHEAVQCEACHTADLKALVNADGTFDECSDCHGRVHGEQFSDQSCESCHVTENRFFDSLYTLERHNKESDYVLSGKHQVLDCQKCHFSGQYEMEKEQYDECSDCHINAHPERQIDQSCEFCHITTSFSWIQFDHNKQTDFRLTGQHREVACLSCHVDQVFKNMPADNNNPNCQMCHQDTHGDSMPNECSNCHRTEGFKLVENFDHATYANNFALEGRHEELSCQKCHSNHLLGDYEVKPHKPGAAETACLNCHIDIHDGEFGENCQSCHNFNTFEIEQGEQVHDLGYFKLAGVHDQMACTTCHGDNTNIQGTGTTCGWCHENVSPHLGQFGMECGDCHSQVSWMPPKWRHNTTAFRLTGSHRYVACESCHVNNIYQGLPNDCYFCHADSYLNSAIIPAHSSGIADCSDCHSTIDWSIQKGAGRDLD